MRSKRLVTVPVAGGDLTVGHWPGDGPTILAVHGITSSHMAWPRLVERLPPGCNVIAPDLRGRGGSVALPGPFGLARHVADLLAVVDHFACSQVVLVGHSLGAYIGVEFAVAARDRLRALVLVDGGIAIPMPPDRTPDEVLAKTLGPAIARLEQTFATRASYQAFWRQHPAFQDPGAWNSDVEAYVDYDLGGTAPALRARVNPEVIRADGRDPLMPRMVTLIDGVATPMLLLTAARGLLNQPKPFLSVEAVAAKDGALPHLTWLPIPDTNHYTIIVGAGAAPSAAAITAFITGLAARGQ